MESIIQKRLLGITRKKSNEISDIGYSQKSDKIVKDVLFETSRYEDSIYLMGLLESNPEEYRKQVRLKIISKLISLSSIISEINDKIVSGQLSNQEKVSLIQSYNKYCNDRSNLQCEYRRVGLLSTEELYSYFRASLSDKDYKCVKELYNTKCDQSCKAIYTLCQNPDDYSFLVANLSEISKIKTEMASKKFELPTALINCQFLDDIYARHSKLNGEKRFASLIEIGHIRKEISNNAYTAMESELLVFSRLMPLGLDKFINFSTRDYYLNHDLFYAFLDYYPKDLFYEYCDYLDCLAGLNHTIFHKKEKDSYEAKLRELSRNIYRKIEKKIRDLYLRFEKKYLPLGFIFPFTLKNFAYSFSDFMHAARHLQQILIQYDKKLSICEGDAMQAISEDLNKINGIENKVAIKANSSGFSADGMKDVNAFIYNSYRNAYINDLVDEIKSSNVNSFSALKVKDMNPYVLKKQ